MKIRLPKLTGAYVPFVLLVLVLTLIFPRAPKFAYEYKKGSEWNYETLYSQFDFPILKTDAQIQEEKSKSASSVIPYYRFSEDVVNKNLKSVEGASLGRHASMKTAIVSVMRDIYNQGVVSDEGVKLGKGVSDIANEVIYIQKDKRATKFPATEVYKMSDAKAKLLAELNKDYRSTNVDSILRVNSIYEMIVPNLIYDKQTSELVHAESGSAISPTQGFVNIGQLIVSKGEIVTGEIAQMLDSYKVEYEANLGYSGPKALMWLGNFMLALALTLIFYLAVFFTNSNILRETNRLLYLMLVFIISTIVALLVNKAGPQYLFMVPFTLSALWLQAFFRTRVILIMYIISLIPLLLFSHAGTALFVMFLLAGFVDIFCFRFFNRGWMQFLTAFITFVAVALLYLGFRMTDVFSGSAAQTIMLLFVGSMLTVLGYPLIFLFERLFNLVSNSRLVELCDTSNKLLSELETKAPGTFQHSLQVMTMSDYVARAIGANAVLVRAGALYHDIGKMNNPLCFVENESMNTAGGEKYHANLDPKESAKAIIAHVSDGLALAEKNGLPELVSKFILTHHGTSATSFFLNKYLNAGGDPEDVSCFYYPGVKPTSKEQVIVMLCDTIEAASRTLKANTAEEYSKFVENIVAAKISDGQFDESDISIKELNIVKESLKSYLAQLYHERVAYPNRKAL